VGGLEKDTGPFIKLPASFVAVMEFGPEAIEEVSSSICKKDDESFLFLISMLVISLLKI